MVEFGRWLELTSKLGETVSGVSAVLSLLVVIYLSILARRASKKLESATTLGNIYNQWNKKKEIALSSVDMLRVDWEIYDKNTDGEFDENVQRRRIYKVLIVDVIFNSVMAAKAGLYPKEIANMDFKVHIGALVKSSKSELIYLVESRGYRGDGSLAEFYEMINRLILEMEQ